LICRRPREDADDGYWSIIIHLREGAMKPLETWVFVVAGMLTAEAALAQDFKSQAATAAAQWDSALNSCDAAKVAQAYTKTAVILRQAANRLMGSRGQRRYSEASSRVA
jgi:hypothetical protein